MLNSYSISGITIVTPDKIFKDSSLIVDGKRLKNIGKKTKNNIHLGENYFMYPAIINVHDHLRGDYLPKVGPEKGTFYVKCSEWEKDLRASKVINERSKITEEECYFLGAYKNLFSGAITVNDHYPHKVNNKYIPSLPIRAIKNYTLEHETTKYSLKWGDGIEIEHKRAVEKNYPFIIHLEEGFDEEYQQGIEVLEKLNCLNENNVLVHCIGFSDEDIKKVKKVGATVVWCPASNYYMYNVTCKIKKILKAGINVAIGTDSTHTGSVNILEEIRFARDMYKRMYGEILPAKKLVEMVTRNPANAFKMQDDIGSIMPGKYADLLIIRSALDDPYEAFVEAKMENIELLFFEGKPIYGSNNFKDFFKINGKGYSQVKVKNTDRFVAGKPKELLDTIRKKVGFKKVLDFLPLDE